MRISAAQRTENENRIRAAMDRLLRGAIPRGGHGRQSHGHGGKLTLSEVQAVLRHADIQTTSRHLAVRVEEIVDQYEISHQAVPELLVACFTRRKADADYARRQMIPAEDDGKPRVGQDTAS